MERIEFLHKVKDLLPPNPMCIEIGTYRGEFAEMIFDVLKPKELHLIDPYLVGNEKYSDGLSIAYSTENDLEIATERFSKKDADGVVFWLGLSEEMAIKFDNGAYDFIYVDGDHTYRGVLIDLLKYLKKIKPFGIIAGHDYHSVFDGVKKAVDDFCELCGYEMLLLNPNGGDFALRKK